MDTGEDEVGDYRMDDGYIMYGNPPNQTLQSAANDYIAQTRG